MARHGVDLHEKLLNHVSRTFSGVQGVFQRYSFADEMRAAMKLWGDHVEKIVRSQESQTVSGLVRKNNNIL
jgi:hypothetical protein